MRLLFLNTYPAWGGGETWMLDIAEGLRARGHHCIIAGRKGRAWFERTRDLGWNPLELNIRGEFAPLAVLKLGTIYRSASIDAVVCNFYKEVRIAGMARLLTGRPAIVNLKGLPLISNTFRHRFGYRHWIDHTVVCARFIREAFLRCPWIDPARLSVIYNCYRPPQGEGEKSSSAGLRRELGLDPQDLIVGAVARFDLRKGLHDLIAAAPAVLAKYPRTAFVLIGDGEERGRLLAQVEKAGLGDRVIFPGFRHDLESIFPAFDVFVLPSHSEGFPYVTQIAMHQKTAIVATRVGGVEDALSDRENGLLVPPHSPPALAEAIGLLLDDPGLRRRLGEAAAATLRERFSYEGMCDQFAALLYGLIQERRRKAA